MSLKVNKELVKIFGTCQKNIKLNVVFKLSNINYLSNSIQKFEYIGSDIQFNYK